MTMQLVTVQMAPWMQTGFCKHCEACGQLLAMQLRQSSGPVPPIQPLILSQKGSLFLTRPVLFHYIPDRSSLEARAADVLGAVASGRLKVRVGQTFPLADAAEAHRALEGRKTTGKVLLLP